jgi:hypothetical protein
VDRRVFLVVLVALAIVAGALLIPRSDGPVPSAERPTLDQMARSLGSQAMRLVVNGHVAGRSGEIMIVPRPHHFMVGDWNLENFGTDHPTVTNSHPNPWDYLVRVPIIFYGPRWVPEGLVDHARTDVTSIAATYGRWLELDGFRPQGKPLEALVAKARGVPKPKVIVTIVIDGGGWNTLQSHPESWPHIRALADGGTTYVNATVGSVPSVTGPIHANVGTGSYPVKHKVPSNPILGGADPRRIKTPTVSDVWSRRSGGRAITSLVAYEGFHIGMLGHGDRTGTDPDIALLWSSKSKRWWTKRPFFEVPGYISSEIDDELFRRHEADLDADDGVEDGLWFDSDLATIRKDYARYGTPAFVRFTGDALSAVVRNEDFGADDVTDLLWVEFKSPDYTGHAWNLVGPEVGATMAEVDRQIDRLRRELDVKVGPDGYVIAISADHGMQPFPELAGGWRIDAVELERDLKREFGDVIEKVTPTDIRIRPEGLDEEGVAQADIARFVGAYTVGENIPEGKPGEDRVPMGLRDDTLFAGAFPSDYIVSLEAQELQALGRGRYREGRYFLPGP